MQADARERCLAKHKMWLISDEGFLCQSVPSVCLLAYVALLCSYLAMPGNTPDGDLWNPPDAETCELLWQPLKQITSVTDYSYVFCHG